MRAYYLIPPSRQMANILANNWQMKGFLPSQKLPKGEVSSIKWTQI